MAQLIVIDNFYPKPKSLLKKINGMRFVEPDDVNGMRTESGYFPEGFLELLENRSGLKVSYLQMPQGTPYDNGAFYHAFAKGKHKEKPGVHWDSPINQMICIVYLTQGLPSEYGTSFYQHKETGLTAAPTSSDAKRLSMSVSQLKEAVYRDCWNKNRFIETDRVGYRFNRALIFPAKRLHAATNHFGENLSNGRIYQVFSFRRL